MGDLTTTNILARLRDPKAAGQDKWMAFCPCHNDGATQGRRSPSVKNEGGKVPAVRIGSRRLLVPRSAILRWLESGDAHNDR